MGPNGRGNAMWGPATRTRRVGADSLRGLLPAQCILALNKMAKNCNGQGAAILESLNARPKCWQPECQWQSSTANEWNPEENVCE